jgi:hypothetical protein
MASAKRVTFIVVAMARKMRFAAKNENEKA